MVAGTELRWDEPVRPLVFSTQALAPREQFDAWRSFMAPVVELDLEGERQAPFEATQTVWDVGSFAMTRSQLPTDRRVRTWTHLRKNALDHWCFVIVNDPSVQPSRSLFYRSLSEPFEGSACDSDILTVYMARDVFADADCRIDGSGSVADEGLGALLADYFVSLERQLPTLPVAQYAEVRSATQAMVSACVQPAAARLERAQNPIAGTLIGRARAIIRRNLGEAGFGPDQLARELGVSRSRLYRLFEPHGGVARYVHRQRMIAAHSALSDASDIRSVGRIAEAFGFHDASGFSRGFKQEFGYSPSDARTLPPMRVPVPAFPKRQALGEVEQFASILHRLSA
jgi:AraC-like DNA-binding protein